MSQLIKVLDLGKIQYQQAWDLQEQILQEQIKHKAEKKNSTYPHHLLLCEHYPVFTLGKSGNEKNLLVSQKFLQEKKIEFYKVNRGGDITFHGAGQIIGYPILDLERIKPDISFYIRNLEETIIQTLHPYGVKGERSLNKETGVWLDIHNPHKVRKICAIGVRCSRWVTMHGFALNVNTDISYFDYIIPCGIQKKKVTSLQQEAGKEIPIDILKEELVNTFCQVFDVKKIQEKI